MSEEPGDHAREAFESFQCLAAFKRFYVNAAVIHMFNPQNPDSFYRSLDFTNLIETALRAQFVYDSIFRSPPTPVHEEEGRVPMGFALEQNVPNPFNTSTSIAYEISQTGPVDVRNKMSRIAHCSMRWIIIAISGTLMELVVHTSHLLER